MSFDATTSNAHWYDSSKALAPTFVIQVWPDAVWLGDQKIPRASGTTDSVIATNKDATFSMNRATSGTWIWAFNGIAGQASGSATER